MTVGIDTYISLAEAETYISAYYQAGDATRQAWTALEDPEKEALLLQACETIDAQPIGGFKAETDQTLAFPRRPYQEAGETAAPEKVKRAQVEIALYSVSAEKAGADRRQALQAQGVQSFSVGEISETYGKGPGQSNTEMPAKAARLLRPYLAGGFLTC